MAKPEWGTKRTCLHCDSHFYDLQRNPIRCPRCNSSFIEPDASFRAQQRQSPTKTVKKSENKTTMGRASYLTPSIESSEEEEELRDSSADESGHTLMEDASDLGADDDDMAEVIERLGDDRDV